MWPINLTPHKLCLIFLLFTIIKLKINSVLKCKKESENCVKNMQLVQPLCQNIDIFSILHFVNLNYFSNIMYLKNKFYTTDNWGQKILNKTYKYFVPDPVKIELLSLKFEKSYCKWLLPSLFIYLFILRC